MRSEGDSFPDLSVESGLRPTSGVLSRRTVGGEQTWPSSSLLCLGLTDKLSLNLERSQEGCTQLRGKGGKGQQADFPVETGEQESMPSKETAPQPFLHCIPHFQQDSSPARVQNSPLSQCGWGCVPALDSCPLARQQKATLP